MALENPTEAAALTKLLKRPKFGNHKVKVDGVVFDSKKEAARYETLKMMEANGNIHTLLIQPKMKLLVHGHLVGIYKPDFSYFKKGSSLRTYEDVKGDNATKTAVYRLKKKLIKAIYDIDIVEV